jgi:hypothetical protein
MLQHKPMEHILAGPLEQGFLGHLQVLKLFRSHCIHGDNRPLHFAKWTINSSLHWNERLAI